MNLRSIAASPAADFNYGLHLASVADALPYLLRAAEDGCLRAQFLVGLAYHSGRGVPIDYARAAAWYRRAAAGADRYAMTNLGIMYLLGQGVEADPIEAYTWIRSVAGLGHWWLRPAVELLERRIVGTDLPDDPSRLRELLSIETPPMRPCTSRHCDPTGCPAI